MLTSHSEREWKLPLKLHAESSILLPLLRKNELDSGQSLPQVVGSEPGGYLKGKSDCWNR